MIQMHEPTVADWNAKRKMAREIAAGVGHRLGRFSSIFYPGRHTSAFAATRASCEGCGQTFVIHAYWRLRLGRFLPYFRITGWSHSECVRGKRTNRVPVGAAA
jgi:hypothetical protein